ncbi:MAG TPA: ATP-binding cassette domain-containing protein, partial [Hyphomicrobiaceae bacterium]|nr:ATP-binding cassette domain-containing protein [Hyphomicrobiaceae bacterium]
VPGLTIQENLRLGLVATANRNREGEMIERMAETFPPLKERLGQAADTLSGGEQQMLAIARALVSEPALIMLDEPSEGIMPVLADEMFDLFARLKRQGTTILLVEQNVERALALADRAYVMDQGLVVHAGAAGELLADREIQERYCAV